ncbi:MAG: ChaB family protein [Pseudomonadota bacterium]|jgi:cation transport regulator|nr:ChaB family protein [Pseudomonadota bacterium]
MPYQTHSQLPPAVRSYLPGHAQVIFRQAFNPTFHAHPGASRQEEIARRIAWAAVKRRYVKSEPRWTVRL